MAAPFDWSSFVVRININVPADKLYQAWATRKGMEHWFLRLSEYKKPDGTVRNNEELIKKGDTYKWLWHGWPDETVEHGQVLEANDKDLFKFSFGKAGNCTVRIYKEQDETIVELLQDNIPTDENGMHYWHVGCKTGWTFYMANMKSLYEGGVDLRNKNDKLQQMLNS
ncbi:MAG: SRPBCC domain-containing protein [Chitinophagaceae bacterium]